MQRTLHLVSVCILIAISSTAAQEKFAGGIIYGPKAAFNISAPEGWVLDNEFGKEQGLPCVLYPKGQSWADAKRSCMPRSRVRNSKM